MIKPQDGTSGDVDVVVALDQIVQVDVSQSPRSQLLGMPIEPSCRTKLTHLLSVPGGENDAAA